MYRTRSELRISGAKPVGNTGQRAVGVYAPFTHSEGLDVVANQFLHNFVHTICMQTTRLPVSFSTAEKRLSDLMSRLFSPLSTPPITTTITYIKTEEQAE